MGPRDRFTGKLVQRTRKPLGYLAAVHEKDGRMSLANQFQQPRMDCIPDGHATWRLRGSPGRDFLHGLEPRHILNWNFNTQL